MNPSLNYEPSCAPGQPLAPTYRPSLGETLVVNDASALHGIHTKVLAIYPAKRGDEVEVQPYGAERVERLRVDNFRLPRPGEKPPTTTPPRATAEERLAARHSGFEIGDFVRVRYYRTPHDRVGRITSGTVVRVTASGVVVSSLDFTQPRRFNTTGQHVWHAYM